MAAVRPIILVAGAAGAVAAAVFTQPLRDREEKPALSEKAGYEVCLKTEMPLFKNASAQCYVAEDLLALLDRPVLDLQGKEVTLTLTHPSDATIAPQQTRSCRSYRELAFDGWFAESTSEMRREGYFVRACGALDALLDAQKPERDFFQDGSPTSEELAGLHGVLRIGEAQEDADRVVVAQPGDFQWRIAADKQFVEMQELANADFDNDGVAEILIFLAGGTEGGTALFYDIGLMQKDAADAPLTYAPLSFGRREAGGASG